MAQASIDPLQYNVRIVDEKGHPTPQFIRQWQFLLRALSAVEVGAVTWDVVEGKPATFPPSEHNHDERYYTETEVDALVSGGGGGGGVTGLPSDSSVAGTDKSVNTTTYADVDNSLDLIVPAATGDVLLVLASCLWGNEAAIWASMDVASVVAGSVVNYVSGLGASGTGPQCWRGPGASAIFTAFGGSILYTVQAGDIDAGSVTLRLRAKLMAAGARTLYASTMNFGVVNLKQ